MNRYDEIQGAARDVADWVCADPADRNRMADELIRLVSLVVKATGKSVAVAGESAMNGPDSEDNASYELFLVGEDLQRAADEVREEATGADIERYERDGLTPVWRPDPDKRRPDVDDVSRRATEVIVSMGADLREITGQRDRYRAAWQSARYRASAVAASLPPVPDPFTGPAPFARGPFAPGELTRLAHETADAMREQHKTPVPDERPLFAPGAEHRWVTTTDGFDRPLGSHHCGVCGEPRCPWIPGDATPGCDHSSGCTTHGLPSARKCPGVPAATPVVSHTWVAATDGDGATPDYVHCGVCGVRKCDGGCGDATVGATPDVDCPVHGDRIGRRCHGPTA